MIARLRAHVHINRHAYLGDSTATPSAKKNRNMRTAMNNAGQNHRGQNTQIQGQVMIPISLARVKIMVRIPPRPMPPPPMIILASFLSGMLKLPGDLLYVAEVVEEIIEDGIISIF